ncbi:hypothetical protein KIPB_011756 [Kipferlia bialata]|uniref:Uncharacterized protein n=1 Tax=Kipferlia bialata TaxID=797122 RepID=A0A9K3D7Z7_9EUKA|nr:hypothetical protein KIPB_011756 [Kipferlia bialata]|eukprot:g11756.t1
MSRLRRALAERGNFVRTLRQTLGAGAHEDQFHLMEDVKALVEFANTADTQQQRQSQAVAGPNASYGCDNASYGVTKHLNRPAVQDPNPEVAMYMGTHQAYLDTAPLVPHSLSPTPSPSQRERERERGQGKPERDTEGERERDDETVTPSDADTLTRSDVLKTSAATIQHLEMRRRQGA